MIIQEPLRSKIRKVFIRTYQACYYDLPEDCRDNAECVIDTMIDHYRGNGGDYATEQEIERLIRQGVLAELETIAREAGI